MREVFERGTAAAVIPYDPKTKKIVMIEQFRAGALKDLKSPWMLEVPAGIIEEGETDIDVVKREALEEAGIEGFDKLIHISTFYPTPGACSETTALFCGHIDSTKIHEGTFGVAAEHEDIQVHLVDLDDATKMVKDGAINNAAAIIGIQWMQLNIL